MLRFNANLFRIAFAGASDEETRYYLKGVFVEPHSLGGVTLTTTDGHRLICIHDEQGFADEKAIIKLGDAIKQCKPKRKMKRVVVVDGNEATILEGLNDAELSDMFPVAKAFDVRIDGTYPDYRRVVPMDFAPTATATFNASYVAEFSKVGNDLVEHFKDSKQSSVMRMTCGNGDASSPTLVRWGGIEQAFGILMPVRGGIDDATPSWFRAPAAMLPPPPHSVPEREVA